MNTGNVTYPAWTGGAGKVNVAAGSKANFAQGTLNADGSFSVVLPRPDASLLTAGGYTDTLPSNCTGNLTASGATDARAVGAEFTVQAGKSGEVAPTRVSLGSTNLEIEVGLYVYYDKAAGLSGQVTCVEDGTPFSGNINLQFNPGWNKVSVRITASETAGSVTMTTGSVPNQWVYSGDAAGSTPLSLGRLSLREQALAPLKSFPLNSLPLPFLR